LLQSPEQSTRIYTSARKDLEQAAEIPHLDKTIGADGKEYPRQAERQTPAVFNRARGPDMHSAAGRPRRAGHGLQIGKRLPISNSPALGNLPPTKVFALLDVPPEDREEFVARHDIENMTTRSRPSKIAGNGDSLVPGSVI
jgi:hypothetical protein